MKAGERWAALVRSRMPEPVDAEGNPASVATFEAYRWAWKQLSIDEQRELTMQWVECPAGEKQRIDDWIDEHPWARVLRWLN